MKKLLFAIAAAFMITACATVPVGKAPPPDEKPPAADEQEERALEAFTEILDITLSSSDRQKVLPEIEKKYFEIIDKYPEAPLAEESSLKLIEMYLNDYLPPAFDKAETVYGKFIDRYPQSILRGFIEETIAKKYYKYAEWDKLLNFTAPIYERYTADVEQSRPALIFLNAEANYSLGNMKDAVKGYKLVMKLFPDYSESSRAKTRLAETGKIIK